MTGGRQGISNEMTSLSIRNITKRFGGLPILDNISIDIEDGEFFSLLGPSGCGKSTLLRIIAGLEQADSGTIAVGGDSIDHLPPQRRGIGFVFQNYALWPHMTVLDNVLFGLKANGTPPSVRKKRVENVLELVQLSHLRARFPHELSGGQQQRVALARALAIRPSVILLDEPLSNLDARLRLDIRNELAALHRELGTTTVYVTHDQDDALSLSNRIALVNSGQVAQIGTPTQLYFTPQSKFVGEFLGSTNLIDATAYKPGIHDELHVSINGISHAPIILHQKLALASSEDKINGTLSIRPESIRASCNPDEQSGKLEAVVVSRQFRGFYELIELRLKNGVTLNQITTERSPDDGVVEGATAYITWTASDLLFLPESMEKACARA